MIKATRRRLIVKILFRHGWTSIVGGLKPTFLKEHGHEVLNPALPDDNFEEAVRLANANYNEHQPDVIVGSSRGGTVAVNMNSGTTPPVLLCPARKNWGGRQQPSNQTRSSYISEQTM
jgi:hypothetical protein